MIQSGKSSKLQSAVEYLTTYSWALLIIAIVLGVLFELGLFNTNQFATPQCVISADFSCLTYYLAENGLLAINLQQATQYPINVTGILCTQNSANTMTSKPLGISGNQITMQIGANYTFFTFCYNTTNGQAFTKAGSVYSGNLQINYTDLTTGFRHSDFGKLVVKAT